MTEAIAMVLSRLLRYCTPSFRINRLGSDIEHHRLTDEIGVARIRARNRFQGVRSLLRHSWHLSTRCTPLKRRGPRR